MPRLIRSHAEQDRVEDRNDESVRTVVKISPNMIAVAVESKNGSCSSGIMPAITGVATPVAGLILSTQASTIAL